MSFQDLILRRELGRMVAAVMNYYNGDYQGNDNEALETLRQEAYKAHSKASLHGNPRLSINVLCVDDVELMFTELTFSNRPKPWMEKRADIPGFKIYTLRVYPEGSSAMIKLHLDALLDYVHALVQPQEPHVRLEQGMQYTLNPVTYKGDTYRLHGCIDYILRYDEQDKMAVKLVVLRAKKLGFKCCPGKSRVSCCGPAQVIALMAMFHQHRKTHGETDCAVYGVASDSVDFWFYYIDNNSEVSSVLLSTQVRPRFVDYEEITGLLGHVFTEAITSSQNNTKQRSNETSRERFENKPQHRRTGESIDGVDARPE